MRVYFQDEVKKSIIRRYRWIPISFFVFIITMLIVIFAPGVGDEEVKFFLTTIMIGFSISLNMFVIQALARIESRQLSSDETS